MRSLLVVPILCALFAVCSGSAKHDTPTPPTPPPGPPLPEAAHVDWPTFGGDVARSSVNSAPTGIDSANVATLTRRQVALPGTVDASAIYLHGVEVHGTTHDVFFVTTSYGKTVAVDADSGTVLWTFTPASYASLAGSAQVTTSTPVADPDRQSIYAASADGHVQKLAVSDGHAEWSTAITLLPSREKIASSLNYYHGHVLATTGGYIGDASPYQGHVVILDAATGALLHVWNSLCSDRSGLLQPDTCAESRSAIWGRGGAVIDTTTGNIVVATGNGTWDGQTFWGDATIVLDSTATHMLGNFTPANTDELNASDADVGSTSPVLLGGGFIAQGGKDGSIRLLDATVMSGTTPHRGGELQSVPTPGGAHLLASPAVFHAGSTTWLFVADDGGTAAWTFDGSRLAAAWSNGTGGTSPFVADGLLYVFHPGGGLRVYQPQTGKLITTLDSGSGHWNTPIVVDGRIALPEGNSNDHATQGVLDIWSAR